MLRHAPCGGHGGSRATGRGRDGPGRSYRGSSRRLREISGVDKQGRLGWYLSRYLSRATERPGSSTSQQPSPRISRGTVLPPGPMERLLRLPWSTGPAPRRVFSGGAGLRAHPVVCPPSGIHGKANTECPITTPQHFVPPTARELRSQAVHRLQVGLFGLCAMLQ